MASMGISNEYLYLSENLRCSIDSGSDPNTTLRQNGYPKNLSKIARI